METIVSDSPRQYLVIALCTLLFTAAAIVLASKASVVVHMVFETGDERLKDLERGVFVGAGRFVVEKGKKLTVEYKVSQVVSR